MFLRVLGRQCLVLTSYRDGYGKVRQRRLGSFRNRDSFERIWRELAADPACRVQLKQLRPKAESLLATLPEVDTRSKARRAVRSLLHILATEPNCVLESELEQLRQRLQSQPPADAQQKVDWERSRLSPRRRHLDPQTTFAQALQERAKQWEEEGELEQGLRDRQELAERTPGEMVQLDYAAALQRVGRGEQAERVLSAMSAQHPWRNLSLANLYWRRGEASLCLDFLLKALARDRQVARVLDRQKRGQRLFPDTHEGQEYWTRFGDLWDEAGREFLLCVAQQPPVRSTRARRPQVHKLVSPISVGWLLDKGLKAARGELPFPYAGPHPL
jgi:hypothetical protein